MKDYKTAKIKDPRFYVYQYNGLLSEIQHIKDFLLYKCNKEVFKIEVVYVNRNENTLIIKLKDKTELKVKKFNFLTIDENGIVSVINEENFLKNFEFIKE